MSVFGCGELFDEFEGTDDDGSTEGSVTWEEISFYKTENNKLKLENEDLRKALRIVTQPLGIKLRERDGPIAHVLLFNNVTSRVEKKNIEEFFQEVASQHFHGNEGHYQLQPSAWHYPPNNASIARKKYNNDTKQKAFIVTDSILIMSKYFCLDQMGEPVVVDLGMPNVPDYDRAHLDALDGEIERTIPGPTTSKSGRRTCFNCGLSDHQLKDCPIPKDFKAISQRKQQFLGQISASPQAGSNRYHVDEEIDEDDPRFAAFKPGLLSDALCEALGISRFELPPYIYQMRMLGYPPGHLEEARLKGSGLSFYSGRQMISDDEELEGAPVDLSKIIDYPGFNVRPASHIVDDYERLGFLPMDERHSKDVMISYYKHRNELLKSRSKQAEMKDIKRVHVNPDVHDKVDDVREIDMDTGDDGCPDLTKVEDKLTADVAITKEQEVIFVSSSDEEGEIIDSDRRSPVPERDDDYMKGVDAGDLDEEELKIRRDLILQELQMEDVQQDVCPTSDGSIDIGLELCMESDEKPNCVEEDDAVIPFQNSPGDESQFYKSWETPMSPDQDLSNDGVPKTFSSDHSGIVQSSSFNHSVGLVEELMNDCDSLESKLTPDLESPGSRHNPLDNMPLGSEPQLDLPSLESRLPYQPTSQESSFPDHPTSVESRFNPLVLAAQKSEVLLDEASPGPIIPLDPASPTSDIPLDPASARAGLPLDSVSFGAGLPLEPAPLRAELSVDPAPPETLLSLDPTRLSTRHPLDAISSESEPFLNPASPRSGLPLNPSALEAGLTLNPASPEIEVRFDPASLGSGLPHRSRFAEGIGTFDHYYRETKSKGVYKKLKSLLKNSPRSQCKD